MCPSVGKDAWSGFRRGVSARWNRWLTAGLDLTFPPKCAFCQEALETGSDGLLCTSCRALFITGEIACGRCGCIVKGTQKSPSQCPRCAQERFHFDATLRLGSYEAELRRAVLRIKRPAERPLAMAMGDLLAGVCSQRCQELGVEVVIPIPMHWSRRMWRGTNAPEAVCERWAMRLKLPTAAHLLVRRRRTAPQANLSPDKRLQNLRGAFRAVNHADLPGARLLLVDDIMTTGATLNEAAKTLRRAGASFVAVVVLARSEGLT